MGVEMEISKITYGKTGSIGSLCLLILIAAFIACRVPCRYPAADGGVEKYSKPSLKGIISSIDDHHLKVEVSRKNGVSKAETYDVIITSKTEIWWDSGAIVDKDEWKEGIVVDIWLEDCAKPLISTPQNAAVIVVH